METPYLVNVNGYVVSYEALEDLGSQLDMMDEVGLKKFQEAILLLKNGHWQLVEDDQQLNNSVRMIMWLVRRLQKDAAMVRRVKNVTKMVRRVQRDTAKVRTYQRIVKQNEFDLADLFTMPTTRIAKKVVAKPPRSHGKRKNTRF